MIYFLYFVVVFLHDIHEVVSINYVKFHWISLIGYTSLTFWKGQMSQNPVSHLTDQTQ